MPRTPGRAAIARRRKILTMSEPRITADGGIAQIIRVITVQVITGKLAKLRKGN